MRNDSKSPHTDAIADCAKFAADQREFDLKLRAIIFVLIACAMGAGTAMAQDARVAKADRIARALGIDEHLRAAQVEGMEMAKQQTELVMSEIRKSGVPEASLAQLATITEQLMLKVLHAWDIQEAGRIWSSGMVDALSDAELLAMEQYVETPEGRKAQAAMLASQQKMTEYISARTNAVMQVEFGKLVEAMKVVVRESRQRKP